MELFHLVIAALGVMSGTVASKKILMLPLQFPSITLAHEALGNALIDLGHEVYMVLPPSIPSFGPISEGRLKVIPHKVIGPDMYKNMTKLREFSAELTGNTFVHIYRHNAHILAYYTMDLLKDKETMASLKSMQFDLAVVDNNPCGRLLFLVPYVLGIPYVSFGSFRDEWSSRNPGLPSHVPFYIGSTYTEQMTFWQRIDNLFQQVNWAIAPNIRYIEQNIVLELVPDCQYTMEELFRRSLLFMVDTDFLIDYPRALMPNEVLIGGITTRPSKPLPSELKEWVSGAEHGIIVMSFGSSIPDVKPQLFMEAFKKVKQRVVWRYFGEPIDDVPANVKLLSWLPQVDLLAHRNTKLFITHCGNKGQHEALYSGTPMIGFPIFGDQMYNAKRMEYHGYGVSLDKDDLTPDNIFKAITEVTTNPKYAQNTQRASEIMQGRPQLPAQKAAWWVDHVMTFGADHLRSYALQMPAYQLLMLDIAVFCIITMFLCLTCSYHACKFLISKCKGQKTIKRD